MNNLKIKITLLNQIKQLFICNRIKLEITLIKLKLDLIIAKNKDIKHLNSIAIKILGCDNNTKNPLTILYITTYSTLTPKRIIDLNKYVDMQKMENINLAMIWSNKGASNKIIIDKILTSNSITNNNNNKCNKINKGN